MKGQEYEYHANKFRKDIRDMRYGEIEENAEKYNNEAFLKNIGLKKDSNNPNRRLHPIFIKTALESNNNKMINIGQLNSNQNRYQKSETSLQKKLLSERKVIDLVHDDSESNNLENEVSSEESAGDYEATFKAQIAAAKRLSLAQVKVPKVTENVDFESKQRYVNDDLYEYKTTLTCKKKTVTDEGEKIPKQSIPSPSLIETPNKGNFD